MFKRVYVWGAPVRILHWIRAICILILSITGYFIGKPIINPNDYNNLYLMSWIRTIHFAAAFIFTFGFFIRIFWFFRGTRFEHWRAWLPLNRKTWKNLFDMAKYYLFLKSQRPPYLGVNPIAALAYLGLNLLAFVEIITGFALFAMIYQTGFWHSAFTWLTLIFNPQYIRMIHHVILWLMAIFFFAHLYLAVLADIEERNGAMLSMISGDKFQPVIDEKK
jgi:Ni/Fe-hydrogenase 1 B-type cytochrome subunit